ncbi:DUF4292 domain-containing protein [Desulfogranum japonicum]|uniref:DUF4292 domain-containing protein n=1 Tax=Desulfogranum japonicum TaxID=231447 RepID=UPI0004064531|nr:DUF4292 domain-containing protein [Desulfogranum japonicum]
MLQFFMLALLVFFAGCGTKIPRLEPLAEPDRSHALARFQEFAEQQSVQALDADIHLRWSVMGQKGNVDGTMQLLAGGTFRVNIVDPIGRPLAIGVGKDEELTVIEIPSGRAFQGPLYGDLWKEYIPAKLKAEQLLPLILGRIPLKDAEVTEIGTVEGETGGVWLTVQERGRENGVHRICFDPLHSVILRDIITNDSRESALNVRYDGYHVMDNLKIPSLIEITGEDIRGSYAIDVTTVYSLEAVSPEVFSVSIPQHFSIEQVP